MNSTKIYILLRATQPKMQTKKANKNAKDYKQRT